MTPWSGLTSDTVHKHYPITAATEKGHMDQSQANKLSTKDQDDTNIKEVLPVPTNVMFETIHQFGHIYTDQTGRFPAVSSTGAKYIFILYSYDTNYILGVPTKNHTDTEILHTDETMFVFLKVHGCQPQTHWMYNEASTIHKQFNQEQGISY